MGPGQAPKGQFFHRACCFSVIGLIVFLYSLYGANMARWRDSPDYGWRAMYDSGPDVVAEVFGRGWQAGLRAGDKILAINGSPCNSFEDLFFNLRNALPGEDNTYTIAREGGFVDIVVTNGRTGFSSVLRRSGPLFAVGLVYAFIGILVYLMKPFAAESRVFLLLAVSLGISIGYSSPADLLSPLWLFEVRQFLDVFLPAPMIHLAMIFPRRQTLAKRIAWLWAVPYGISLILFVLFQAASSAYWNSPAILNTANGLYLLAGALIFVGSTIWNMAAESSPLVRLQSQVIFIGILLGFLVPSAELFARTVLDTEIFRNPDTYFALFLSAFPLAVGYTIVRYNLFAIDTMVRRAYGYGLSVAIVVGSFAAVVSLLNYAFSGLDIWRKPAFSLLFAIAAVTIFGPLHARIQSLVNRVFFRGRVDYKDAVTEVSDALTSVLDLDEVVIRIIHAVRDVMSVDSAGVILRQPGSRKWRALFIHEAGEGGREEKIVEEYLDQDDPLVLLSGKGQGTVSIYDVAESPLFPDLRERCLVRFEQLHVTIVFPMAFKGETIGMLAAGRKKSGRFFSGEDADLLRTLANQGAVAVENARRAQSMKTEELVRANLSRYLSPQVVERVMRRKVDLALGGDRKVVTVLISDIRGFTALSETLEPDRLAAVLNEYFTEMAGVVFRHRGSLDKYVGDSLVAVFGSLIQVRNPTRLAVEASVEMMRRLGELNGKWGAKYPGFRMEIGIGIDRGEVFLGNVGSPERMEFTVIGKPVNTASLLSESSGPGQILIAGEAAGEVEKDMTLRAVPPVSGKKKSGEIEVFEVVYR